MNTQIVLELLGYAASVLIATSLMMRSIVRLRLINLAGALTFSTRAGSRACLGVPFPP